jgi:Leucine-rich repeat (LRR) protein
LPPQIAYLANLTFLDASVNKIVILTPSIGQLKKLKSLILNRNKMKTLPPEIGNLQSLIYLDLWGTLLTGLPDEIGKMKNNLKVLDLRVVVNSNDKQSRIQKLLPDTDINFSKGCNCQ